MKAIPVLIKLGISCRVSRLSLYLPSHVELPFQPCCVMDTQTPNLYCLAVQTVVLTRACLLAAEGDDGPHDHYAQHLHQPSAGD